MAISVYRVMVQRRVGQITDYESAFTLADSAAEAERAVRFLKPGFAPFETTEEGPFLVTKALLSRLDGLTTLEP